MAKMTLTTTFTVPDDHRGQSRIAAAIDSQIEALEVAITAQVNEPVKIVSKIVRVKNATTAPITPAATPETPAQPPLVSPAPMDDTVATDIRRHRRDAAD